MAPPSRVVIQSQKTVADLIKNERRRGDLVPARVGDGRGHVAVLDRGMQTVTVGVAPTDDWGLPLDRNTLFGYGTRAYPAWAAERLVLPASLKASNPNAPWTLISVSVQIFRDTTDFKPGTPGNLNVGVALSVAGTPGNVTTHLWETALDPGSVPDRDGSNENPPAYSLALTKPIQNLLPGTVLWVYAYPTSYPVDNSAQSYLWQDGLNASGAVAMASQDGQNWVSALSTGYNAGGLTAGLTLTSTSRGQGSFVYARLYGDAGRVVEAWIPSPVLPSSFPNDLWVALRLRPRTGGGFIWEVDDLTVSIAI